MVNNYEAAQTEMGFNIDAAQSIIIWASPDSRKLTGGPASEPSFKGSPFIPLGPVNPWWEETHDTRF